MSRRRSRGEEQTTRGVASVVSITDPIELMIARAQKLRRRDETRKALVLLREAAATDEWRARTWTILAAFLADLGRDAEAMSAFKQAKWLRVRAGERARADITAKLMAQVTASAA
jgi:Flp pilus assembly protein TadD